jgi:hypothetical protein
VSLSGYLGSLLRGVFGAKLRWISCPRETAECGTCESRGCCAYGYVFNTPVPDGAARLRTHQDVPRPFVIQPPPPGVVRLAAGQNLDLHLVLFGRTIDYLPHFVWAFREINRLAQSPATSRERNVQLEEFVAVGNGQAPEQVVWSASHPERVSEGCTLTGQDVVAHLPAGVARTVSVEFLTMTRLKHNAGYVRQPEFHVLARNLLRRIANLLYFHGDSDLNVDFRDLIDRAQRISLTHDGTRWVGWPRHSGRQNMTMDLGGFVGKAHYAGDLAPFLPLLLVGEYAHVGKNATFGLGRFKVTL